MSLVNTIAATFNALTHVHDEHFDAYRRVVDLTTEAIATLGQRHPEETDYVLNVLHRSKAILEECTND